jgi:hypothetical protein
MLLHMQSAPREAAKAGRGCPRAPAVCRVWRRRVRPRGIPGPRGGRLGGIGRRRRRVRRYQRRRWCCNVRVLLFISISIHLKDKNELGSPPPSMTFSFHIIYLLIFSPVCNRAAVSPPRPPETTATPLSRSGARTRTICPAWPCPRARSRSPRWSPPRGAS